MKKVEVKFDADFESDKLLPIHISRIYLGPYIGRLAFFPDGVVRLYIDDGAVLDGYLVLVAPVDSNSFFGAPNKD